MRETAMGNGRRETGDGETRNGKPEMGDEEARPENIQGLDGGYRLIRVLYMVPQVSTEVLLRAVRQGNEGLSRLWDVPCLIGGSVALSPCAFVGGIFGCGWFGCGGGSGLGGGLGLGG